jgi:hypothetical protein
MRKFTVAACAAGVLATAILGLAGSAAGGGATRAPLLGARELPRVRRQRGLVLIDEITWGDG